MNYESFLEKITTPASPDNILVCEASFTGLRAVVVDKKSGKLTAGYEASSSLIDLNEAIDEVVQKIKQQGWKGQHAIVVSPAVCLTVLDLNIPAKNKLHVQQIAEAMQWEFEPAFNQYKNVLAVGQLLQVHGYMDASQVKEILQQQNELLNSKNSAVTYKLFGELALAAEFINKKQLADVLARQKWFVSEGDTIKCGWSAASWQPMADMGDYKWLVAGVKQELLRGWQAIFSKYEVKLEAFYPMVGGGSALQADEENDAQTIAESKEIILEAHRGVLAGAIVTNSSPMQIQTVPSTKETVLEHVSELIQGLRQDDDVPIKLIDCLSNNQQESEQLVADVRNILSCPVEVLETTSGKISVAMRNATRHFLRSKSITHVEGVSAHDPLAPVMQRFSVRAVLASLLIVGLIVLSEVGFLGTRFWINSQSAAISTDVTNIRDEVKRINKKAATVKSLKADIAAKETEKKNATTMISLLTKELPERNQALIMLMDKLQNSVTEDVVINSITEDTLLGFNFKVWALSDQASQSFVKNFQLAIHSLNYRIKNLTVNENAGRLGLLGYSVKFSITPLTETEYNRRKKLKRSL